MTLQDILHNPLLAALLGFCAVIIIVGGVFAGIAAGLQDRPRRPRPPPMRTANSRLIARQVRDLQTAQDVLTRIRRGEPITRHRAQRNAIDPR